MLIEHPERFGLAQLHQLRGRIGRGAEESYCILLADGPGFDRLRAFAATARRVQDRGAGPGRAGDGRSDRGAAVGRVRASPRPAPGRRGSALPGSRAGHAADRRRPGAAAVASTSRSASARSRAIPGPSSCSGWGRAAGRSRHQGTRIPTPVACRRLRTSGSKGMLSGLWVFRVISRTNSDRRAQQGALPGNQPAAGAAVVVQRRLVEALDLAIGVVSVGSQDAAGGIEEAGILDGVERLVGPVVRPGGEQVHADGPGSQRPFAVADQRSALLRLGDAVREAQECQRGGQGSRHCRYR